MSSTFASPTNRSSGFILISMGPKWWHRQFSVKVVVFNTHPNIQNVMNSCRAAPTIFLKSSPTTVFHIHLLRLVQTLFYFFSFLGIIQQCVFSCLCVYFVSFGLFPSFLWNHGLVLTDWPVFTLSSLFSPVSPFTPDINLN